MNLEDLPGAFTDGTEQGGKVASLSEENPEAVDTPQVIENMALEGRKCGNKVTWFCYQTALGRPTYHLLTHNSGLLPCRVKPVIGLFNLKGTELRPGPGRGVTCMIEPEAVSSLFPHCQASFVSLRKKRNNFQG